MADEQVAVGAAGDGLSVVLDLDVVPFWAALDTLHDGVLIFDADELRLGYANAGALRQSGYRLTELLGMTPLELWTDLGPVDLRSRLDGLAPGASRELTTTLRRRDGEKLPVEVVVSAGGTDRDRWFVALSREVSARRPAERPQGAERDIALNQAHDVALNQERERIARDLHDRVIQQLFATGLGLQALRGRTSDPSVRSRLDQAVADLDVVIHDLRSTIFGLVPDRMSGSGVREEIFAVARNAGRTLGFQPRLRFEGPVDTAVDDTVRQHLLSVLREALSNVIRHASASRVDVSVAARDGIVLRVVDDGVGIPEEVEDNAGDGLFNMARRARELGGAFRIRRGHRSGTELEWSVPFG